MRLGWRLTAGILAYALAFYGVLWGLAAVFGKLFVVWNLTNANLAYAPVWAQQIVLLHTDFTYALVYIASFFAASVMARRWSRARKGETKMISLGLLIGLGLGALLTAVAFAFDSMRLESPLSEPSLSGYHLSALIVLLLGSLSGEALTKRLAFDPVRERLGRFWGYIAAAILSVLLSGSWTSPLGLLNALLMSIVGCALYERGGILASAALGVGWSAWTTWLFAWPNAGSASIYRMYTVSEAWLTGGNAGANCGLGAAIGWIIIAAVLLRGEWSGICRKIKERNTNGKDSHCNRRSGLER